MPNNLIIHLDDVYKIYFEGQESEVRALQGITLKVKKGEFIAIIGKSGSGKSTAMNLIGCLDIPSRGKAYLDNQNIANLSESSLAHLRGKKIGFIFQRFNLIPSLTAKENVGLPMLFQKLSRTTRLNKASKLLNLVGLQERADHFPAQLSGGESQRVAIARSLANDPELILADEPTGNLDTKTGEQIMDLLTALNKKEGKTIIMITHDTAQAQAAERLIKLRDGQILTDE
ncbi:lipoprotein-releasing system ATP-binding protein LolD [archaeon]|nr:lipoprotein-releasing system ATP-binding protein LolD [archaeon]|tara:strand:- start:161 stop:850 length:690 start_codon:yes stop_codon:yes gene_type:complete